MKLSKKLLSLLLCAVMVLGSVAVGGKGFAEALDNVIDAFIVKASAEMNPEFIQVIERPDSGATKISTAEQLAAIANDMYGNYVLTNDINLSAYGSWTPIGKNKATPFKGKLDGQGFSIIGMTVNVSIDSASLNSPAHGVGLFGICDGATVKNLSIKDANVSVSSSSGYEYTNVSIDGRKIYAGAVAGYIFNNSVIYNVHASGSVSAKSTGEADSVVAGGLVGLVNSAIVSFSYSNCSVKATTSTITTSNADAGGIIGLSKSSGYIDRCYNTGTVDSTVGDYGVASGGGLIGKSMDLSFVISDSFNEGTVTAGCGNMFADSSYAGGIAGYFNGSVSQTYNSGKVYAVGSSIIDEEKTYAGGICGFASSSSIINNSAIVNPAVSAQGATKKSFRISNGGTKSNNISSSTYTSGNTTDAQEYFDANSLKTESPYSGIGFDFSTVWSFVSGKDYPQLRQVAAESDQYRAQYIQQHIDFINGSLYSDILNNKRYASMYWSEEYCGKNNAWYVGFDAFSKAAKLKFGELFEAENLFSVILSNYINNEGVTDNIVTLAKMKLPGDIDVKYEKAKQFISKYWEDSWGKLDDEDIFYLFHYDDKTSEEWITENFEEHLEEIVYDTKHEGEWLTKVFGVADESLTEIKKWKDKANNCIDFINGMITTASAVDTFMSTSEEFREILKTISNNVNSDLVAELSETFGYTVSLVDVMKLNSAIDDYTRYFTDNEDLIRQQIWLNLSLDDPLESAYNKATEICSKKLSEWLTGKLSSNAIIVLKALGWIAEGTNALIDYFTGEGDMEEYRALLQANSIFEAATYHALCDIQDIFVSDKSFESAQLFDAAFKFFKETEIYSMDILVKLLDTFQSSMWTTINNASDSTKASEIEEILINKRALYNTMCHGTSYDLGGKIITIACPTDVEIYDNNNNLAASVRNDVPEIFDNSVTAYVTHSVKYFVVPLGSDFSVKIIATDDGIMEYSVAEYDESVHNVLTAIYTGINLKKNKVFTGNISGDLCENENAYNLYTSGQEIEATFVDSENNSIIAPTSFSITESSIDIAVGNIANIGYLLSPGNVSVDTIIWSSSDENVVTVSETGVITAVGTGNATVTGVTFVGGINDSISVSVFDPNVLSITTDSLPSGCVNLPYNEITLHASKDNIIWSVMEGSLPDGLSLSKSGIISGTPLKEGEFEFKVKAESNNNQEAYRILLISVPYTAKAPIIKTDILPDGNVGIKYNEKIQIDAIPHATVSVISGNLPDGLEISENGLIIGIPSKPGTFTFEIEARNGVLPNGSIEFTLNINESIITSGSDGNLEWELTTNGVLNIECSGAMPEYTSGKSPWFNYANQVKSIRFEGNVTHIGSYTFDGCSSLKSLEIPNTVTSVSEYAINNSALESLTLPFVGSSVNAKNTYDSVLGYIFGRSNNGTVVQYFTEKDGSLSGYKYNIPLTLTNVTITNASTIPFGAFYNCSGIENLQLNDGIDIISKYAFANMSAIKTIVIPDSVVTIEEYALNGCDSLEKLTVPFIGTDRNANNDYNGVLGVIFGRIDATGVKQYCRFDSGSIYYYYYAIPVTLKIITVTDDPDIPIGAFSGSAQIKEIYLSDNTTSIDEFAVYQVESFDKFAIYSTSCEIKNQYNTFSISGTIYGYKGSTAEIFANKKSIQFVPLDNGHTHKYESCVTDPTCLNQGYTTYTCSCGETYVSDYVAALGHTPETIPGKEPTCQSTGLTVGSKCTVCGTILKEQEIIPLKDHTPGSSVRENEKAADCTTKGSYEDVVYCKVCKAEMSRVKKELPVVGHKFTNYISNNDATCSANGTKTAKCDFCDVTETIVDEGSIKNHTFTETVVNPTCTEKGYTVFTCLVCKFEKTDDYVDELGHDIVHHNEKASTCTKDGYKAYDTCSRCDYSTFEEIAKTGHSLIHHSGKEATCTEDGYKAYDTCANCNYSTFEVIEHTGHKPGKITIENATESSCIAVGEYDEVTYCMVCGTELSRVHKYKSAGQHVELSAVMENIKEATCTEDGYYDSVVYCGVCHNELSRERLVIVSKGHQYNSVISEPTCSEQGFTTYTCTCGYYYVDSFVPARGHKYIAGVCERCKDVSVEAAAAEAVKDLEAVKSNAKSDEAKAALDTAIANVDKATNLNDIATAKSNGITAAANADKALADAKATAKSELTTAKNNAKSDEAKAALDTAIANVDKATTLKGVADAKLNGLTNAESADKTYADKFKFDTVSIKTADAKTIDYRSIVTIKATANGIPEGYKLAIYLGSQKVAEGDNKSVSYEYGEIKSDLNYTVKVIDANGKVQKDSNGNALSKDSGKITCNAGFFKKLVAFFKGLFKSLPKVEVKP